MTIPAPVFSFAIIVCTLAAALTPVILLALFVRDRKKGTPW